MLSVSRLHRVVDRMINGTVGGMRIGRGKPSTEREPVCVMEVIEWGGGRKGLKVIKV
jgi:hypothetical protein